MNQRSLYASLAPLLLIASGCSGTSDGNPAGATDVAPDGAAAQGSNASVSGPQANASAPDVPVISARNYVSGSAKTKVTGTFSIDEDIAINTQASISDGSMTWLQYGASGAETPNILVTVNKDLNEIGINVGKGKPTSTVTAADCKGGMEVADKLVTGHYTCKGAASYDPRSGAMGQVDIEVSFTAGS
jgi:hypothetical protein